MRYMDATHALCALRQPEDRLRRLRELARERGGKCLSERYLGVKEKLLWECAALHRWEATPFAILRGSWCPQCYWAGLRLGIEALRAEAKKRGGECLADAYDTVEQKLEWRCARGHVWSARASRILEGSWCPVCARDAMRLGLEEMRGAARQKGGECLSEHYETSSVPLDWRCARGHVFRLSPDGLTAGRWCPVCAQEDRYALRLERMRKIAQERGGLCLSDVYTGSRDKLLWQCHQGHVWQARPVAVTSGTWCPVCAHLNQCASDKARVRHLAARHVITATHGN
jgi:hypothetical protein